MVRKGNLLYNGDFETQTAEGWILGAYGLTNDFEMFVDRIAAYKGEAGGWLNSLKAAATTYVAYDKICSFEEYEAYLYIVYINNHAAYSTSSIVYGLDDKGNYIKYIRLGYNNEKDVWRSYQAILRGFGDITHFTIGVYAYADNPSQWVYFDEAKLIPLRSVKSHILTEYKFFSGLTSDKTWFSTLACIGKCKLRSILKTENASGTDPSLSCRICVSLLDNPATFITLNHNTIYSNDINILVADLPEISYLTIIYELGGTSPSFDVYHHLRVEPY